MDEDVPSQEEFSEDVKPQLGLISDVCLGPLEEVDLVAEAAVVVKGPKTKRKKNARRRKMKVNMETARPAVKRKEHTGWNREWVVSCGEQSLVNSSGLNITFQKKDMPGPEKKRKKILLQKAQMQEDVGKEEGERVEEQMREEMAGLEVLVEGHNKEHNKECDKESDKEHDLGHLQMSQQNGQVKNRYGKTTMITRIRSHNSFDIK